MRRCPRPLVSMKVPCVRFSPTERPMAMGVSLSLKSWKTRAGMVLRAARPGALKLSKSSPWIFLRLAMIRP